MAVCSRSSCSCKCGEPLWLQDAGCRMLGARYAVQLDVRCCMVWSKLIKIRWRCDVYVCGLGICALYIAIFCTPAGSFILTRQFPYPSDYGRQAGSGPPSSMVRENMRSEDDDLFFPLFLTLSSSSLIFFLFFFFSVFFLKFSC